MTKKAVPIKQIPQKPNDPWAYDDDDYTTTIRDQSRKIMVAVYASTFEECRKRADRVYQALQAEAQEEEKR